MYGVLGATKKAKTPSFSITSLHPLDGHNEGMKGLLTRRDIGG